MKGTLTTLIIIFVSIAAIGSAIILKKYVQPKVEVQTVAGAQVTASTTPEIHYIGLTKGKAEPADVLIKVGDYVEFDSKDGKPHDIASGKGNDYGEKHDHTHGDGVESGAFAADEGYKVQFKQIGMFFFHDHLNPNIAISVAVYDPNKK